MTGRSFDSEGVEGRKIIETGYKILELFGLQAEYDAVAGAVRAEEANLA